MRVALVVCAVCLPAIGGAAEHCPWLNAATAGGFLGGAVTSISVKQAKAGDDASCEFVRHEGSVVFELRIDVETMHSPTNEFGAYAARCRSDGVPLKAIGNEALACRDEGGDGRFAEQVVGRVRDHAFVVRVSTSDRSAERSVMREKAHKVAEQVAGILF